MISKKLILFKQYFLYEGKKYTIDEFFNNINEIYKNIKIIIAENEMFISQYKLEDNNVTVFLDNIMMNNEVNNENILTDYYYNKRKKILYLYSLNEGKYINKIANDKTIVKVIPIQFYIRNILKIALYRKSKVLVITKIHKNIYAIISEKGCITYSNILTNDKNVLNNEILKFAKDIEIILDKELEDFLVDDIKKSYKISIKSIGRNISEKIYKI
ncbi:hypothetical protein [uncultured Clostridium sp.]|uniref:hypothetical protein n=1 Tax=uncultured Clostridium sp. TaxID=59620 RepID=UPI002673F0C8|nr:hypothetical protein [uncultured Clostridium sp.]